MIVYCVIRCFVEEQSLTNCILESLEEIFLNKSDAENYIEQLRLNDNAYKDDFEVQEYILHETYLQWVEK